MRSWKITGIIATLVIVISIPAYILKEKYLRLPVEVASGAAFVGGQKCAECHKSEFDKWRGSHHDLAMDEANETTVSGNFDNAVFKKSDVTSRFYRKDGKFFVNTQGPQGQMGDFEVTYVFGVYPLQQYLVPFPGGRLQCLPLAWDVEGRQWYHLYPDAAMAPDDWLYWTNAGQNWNGMCAECHSTNLKKNFDPKTNAYRTTWSEIDVSCEACHGPGSRHVEWAEIPDMARPLKENYELVVKTSGIDSREQVELCAPCHSRRAILGDYTHAEKDLMDTMLPTLLTEELYFADGQIQEEVYVYGSFTQSKMYERDVRCSDCHDVHSIKPMKKGNALCLQCHRADLYDTREHHFHKKKGETGEPLKSDDGRVLHDVGTGAECVQCHMPGRYYMGIDYRPDHSIRIPRPDLSLKLGTPNACNRCHGDKTERWSDETITKWYGPGRRAHYATIIEAGRKRLPSAQPGLIRLAADPLYPVIVRATALTLLQAYPPTETNPAYETALVDDEALIRRIAVDHLILSDLKRQTPLLISALYDPVKAVRLEAARRLTEVSDLQLDDSQAKKYQTALQGYREAMEYSADFAFGRYNLGNLDVNLKMSEPAVENFRAAIRIDNQFYPAKVNLAMLLNQMDRKDETERLLREVVSSHPELFGVQYSLGLLLAEKKHYDAAAQYLAAAAAGMPDHARVHYNLGMLLDFLQQDREAQSALLRALDIEPANLQFLNATAEFYLKRNRHKEAKMIAERMTAVDPLNRVGQDLLKYINRKLDADNQ
jgi:tetratricopeptide (TPR) repeat protein